VRRRLEEQLNEYIPSNIFQPHRAWDGRFFTAPLSVLAKLALIGVIVELCNCEQAAPHQALSFALQHEGIPSEKSKWHYYPNIFRQAQIIAETWSGEEICRVGFDPRNPKPETDSEDLTSPGPIETRTPKLTFKTWFPEDRPKPETDYKSWFQITKPETDYQS